MRCTRCARGCGALDILLIIEESLFTKFNNKQRNFSGLHLGTTFLENNWDKDIIGMEDLQNFLEIENVMTLFAVIEEIEDNKRMKFFKTVSYMYLIITNQIFCICCSSQIKITK